jgi:hypothetical protein
METCCVLFFRGLDPDSFIISGLVAGALVAGRCVSLPSVRCFWTEVRPFLLSMSITNHKTTEPPQITLRCFSSSLAVRLSIPSAMFSTNPENWGPLRDLHQDFGFLLVFEHVNIVDHGDEVEAAVAMTMEHANKGGKYSCRCRRGGKTSMLHAVASRLSHRVDRKTHVIYIMMNEGSTYLVGAEDAYQAILGHALPTSLLALTLWRVLLDSWTDILILASLTIVCEREKAFSSSTS